MVRSVSSSSEVGLSCTTRVLVFFGRLGRAGVVLLTRSLKEARRVEWVSCRCSGIGAESNLTFDVLLEFLCLQGSVEHDPVFGSR